jgi:single-stranded DNA-binding protein
MSDKKINRFDYTGKLTRVETFTSKAGKPIRTLVFHEPGQWEQWIAVKVFGRLAEQASDWTPGTILEIRGHLGGREYQGKIYPENIAETVEVVGEAQRKLPTGNPQPPDDGSDVPF